MKIALITIHRANNYGAVLQAYATQRVLSQLGDVRVLDHRNPYINRTLQYIRFGGGPRGFLRAGKDLLRLRARTTAIRKFEAFIEEHLRLQPFDPDLHERIEEEFDAFVSGSDQIWNPSTVSASNTFDTAYMLDFVRKKRKISYASSIGSYQLNNEKKTELKRLLTSYSALSARESDTAVALSDLLGRRVEHLLDPTLLLTRDQWQAAFARTPDNSRHASTDYVLCFALKKDALFRSAAAHFAEKLGLPLVALDQDPVLGFAVSTHIKDAGPAEFVELFTRAKYIVTNSFHGTAFALNFRKPFAAVLPPTGGNRLESLLRTTGLCDRLIKDHEALQNFPLSTPKFEQAAAKLDALRDISIEYLRTALHA